MPSIEDYAPDGGNAPIENKSDPEYDRKREAAKATLDELSRKAKNPGANSAMVIPTARGYFQLDAEQREELLKRPEVYVMPDEVSDVDEDHVLADGPWLAVAIENGEWLSGELVGVVGDSITLRKIHSMDDDGITYWDTTVETERCVAWHTLEGDRWTTEAPSDEPEASVDPLTGFPRRIK